MQKAIIVRYRYRQEQRDSALEELNELLAGGWRIVDSAPMGGTTIIRGDDRKSVAIFASLIVLEK